MAQFFIGRPIFAWVIAIIIMVAGALSIFTLPVSMYPAIAPPTVSINANYPGASEKVVEDSVTQVIEQNMKGLDGLLYMSSTSSSNGSAGVTLTFDNGVDPDIAQVQVQNKLQLAMPLLPQEVQRQGVNVSKASSGFLMVLGFVSEDGSMDKVDIADYVSANVVDPISRVPGVGNIQVFGSQYAMRIWLDPDKLETYKLAPSDIIRAVQAQNQQVAVGQLGDTPSVPGTQLNATITAQGRLQTAEQFQDIVVRSNPDGSILRLEDVARVELGSGSYGFQTRYNRQPASGLAIMMATGANALDRAAAVEAALNDLEAAFPPGLQAVIPFETTPFVRIAIENVIEILLEAIVLVFLVMYLFLQNFRATLIPTIAVPVVLLGTLGVISALGMSANMLTMFAMVLAIGLLVDDAIVVVENVERLMSEEGLSPTEATRKSMRQITGALVAIGLVLSAVFVPMAFLDGATGVIYRQFSATIVSAMALSVLIAIVLTPALCATMLKPLKKGEHHDTNRFFRWFNDRFDRSAEQYRGAVRGMLARSGRFMAVFAAMAIVMVVLVLRLPSSFLPAEDQGMLFAMVQGPVGSTQERTMEAVEQLEDHFLEAEPAVESLFTVQGFSFAGTGEAEALHREQRFDRRLRLQEVVFELLDRLHRAFLRRTDRPLDHREQHALVLGRQERARQAQNQHHHHDRHRGEHRHEAAATREHAAHRAAVLFRAAVEAIVEPAEKAVRVVMFALLQRLQHRRAQRGRQHDRDQHRQRHRRDDRRGELPINHAGRAIEERHRHEHGRQHEPDRDQRAGDLAHRFAGRLGRRQPLLAHQPFDIFDDDDRVVDKQPDREHHREHRQHVRRHAERGDHPERTEQHDRHGDGRNQGRAEVLQEQVHHEEHEHDRLEQDLDHVLDRDAHERRRLERDHGLQARWERGLEVVQRGFDGRRPIERVRAGCHHDCQTAGRLPVVARLETVAARAEFDARDVFEPQDGAIRVAAHDDILELLRGLQAALRGDGRVQLRAGHGGRVAELPDRHLLVLRLHRADDVRGRELVGLELVGVEPDAHRVLRSEHLDVADAGDAADRVDDVRGDVVRDVDLVHAPVLGHETEHHQEAGARLADVDALALDFLRQQRHRELQLVLNLHLRDVRVDAVVEREGHACAAVRRTGR